MKLISTLFLFAVASVAFADQVSNHEVLNLLGYENGRANPGAPDPAGHTFVTDTSTTPGEPETTVPAVVTTRRPATTRAPTEAPTTSRATSKAPEQPTTAQATTRIPTLQTTAANPSTAKASTAAPTQRPTTAAAPTQQPSTKAAATTEATTPAAVATTTMAEPTTQPPTTTTPQPPRRFCDSDAWLYNNGNCYWSSVINGLGDQGADSNWYRALVTCSQLGANLLSIHSSAQNSIVYPMTCAPHVWLGLVATGAVTEPSKGWSWTDLSANNYTDWGTSGTCCRSYRGSCQQYCPFPENKFGCSFQATDTRKWGNDRDCQRSQIPFVCEKPALYGADLLVAPVHLGVEVDNAPQCDFGWAQYKGSCYYVSQDQVDYFEAELTCRSLGAQIASVHSSGESGFILVSLGSTCQDLWIGLVNINPSAMTSKQSWEWDDMSEFKFDNWPKHVTPFDDRTKLCTTVSTAGYWYNKPCNSLNRFVCKKAPYQSS